MADWMHDYPNAIAVCDLQGNVLAMNANIKGPGIAMANGAEWWNWHWKFHRIFHISLEDRIQDLP
jgi:hypothetical protein